MPPVNVMPIGRPPVWVIVGLGPPEAVMFSGPNTVATVMATAVGVVAGLVKAGGAMLTGVTETTFDAPLLP